MPPSPEQIQWLTQTVQAAKDAEHIFPEMAGAEAALESNYGASQLAREANNLFGMKQHTHPLHGTLVLPTKEFLNSQWVVTSANWVKYDTLAECFEDRMETLERLKSTYPHYAMALAATDPVTYIFEVSRTWSTDPLRSAKCLSIYNAYHAAMAALPADNADAVNEAANGAN